MSNPFVYDKAEYHTDGDYPPGLPQEQAFVHTAMYLGWIVDNGLYSEEFAEEPQDAELITQFQRRETKPTALYSAWDGCLTSDMLNDEGNAFSQDYFDFDKGRYLSDYEELLAADLPSLYHVSETWENYHTLAAHVSKRYTEWKQTKP